MDDGLLGFERGMITDARVSEISIVRECFEEGYHVTDHVGHLAVPWRPHIQKAWLERPVRPIFHRPIPQTPISYTTF